MARSSAAIAGVAIVALAGSRVGALPQCDAESTCTYNFPYAGGTFTLDLRGLCNLQNDYQLTDSAGHTYYAQICGTANKKCLPEGWENQYEYGRSVQTWGPPPTCDCANGVGCTCVEETTGIDVCCTESCQVIAVQAPVPLLIDSSDITKGFELFYTGEAPTSSDPYYCDWNPATGNFFPRTTHMQFFCDPSADGWAQFYEVDQNATDDCDYTLKFKTSAACLTKPLSSGWTFSIIVIVCSLGYVSGAFLWSFYTTRTWALPKAHVAFWSGLNALALEGVLFTLNGFRKPSAAALGALYGQPLASADGNKGGYGSTPAFGGSSSSGYNGDADAAPVKSAYTDL